MPVLLPSLGACEHSSARQETINLVDFCTGMKQARKFWCRESFSPHTSSQKPEGWRERHGDASSCMHRFGHATASESSPLFRSSYCIHSNARLNDHLQRCMLLRYSDSVYDEGT